MAAVGTLFIGILVACYLALGLKTQKYTVRTRALLVGVTTLASIAFYMLS